jgi:iron complex outermembrane receptor protein
VYNNTGQVLAGATITLGIKNVQRTQTNENGEFGFSNVKAGKYNIKAEFIGMQTLDTSVNVTANSQLKIQLNPSEDFLQPLEVSSVRASDRAPFTKTNITKTDIAKLTSDRIFRSY